MSESDKDKQTPPSKDGAIDFNFNLNELPKDTDPAMKELLTQALANNKEMAAELAEAKKYREKLEKKEEDTLLEKYNLDRTKILTEIEDKYPHLLEENKESHLNELQSVIKTARTFSNKLSKLKDGGIVEPPNDDISYACDRVKKENPTY